MMWQISVCCLSRHVSKLNPPVCTVSAPFCSYAKCFGPPPRFDTFSCGCSTGSATPGIYTMIYDGSDIKVYHAPSATPTDATEIDSIPCPDCKRGLWFAASIKHQMTISHVQVCVDLCPESVMFADAGTRLLPAGRPAGQIARGGVRQGKDVVEERRGGRFSGTLVQNLRKG